MNVKDVINSRTSTHGEFNSNAKVAQSIQQALSAGDNFDKLSAPQLFALQNIAGKMARIVNGNPDEPDHWVDIAGYATLVHDTHNEVESAFEQEVVPHPMPNPVTTAVQDTLKQAARCVVFSELAVKALEALPLAPPVKVCLTPLGQELSELLREYKVTMTHKRGWHFGAVCASLTQLASTSEQLKNASPQHIIDVASFLSALSEELHKSALVVTSDELWAVAYVISEQSNCHGLSTFYKTLVGNVSNVDFVEWVEVYFNMACGMAYTIKDRMHPTALAVLSKVNLTAHDLSVAMHYGVLLDEQKETATEQG